MDISSSLSGLRTILGADPTPPATIKSGPSNGPSALSSDRATFSSAGSEVSQSAGEDGVRMDKVAAVQAALAAGTYNVPASAVASKMVDAMLASS